MKIAIVTGASSGMGREFVRQIAAKEPVDEIWAVARRKDRLEALKKEFPKVRPVALDLLLSDSRKAFKKMLAVEKPEIRILVNASGFGKYGTYKDLTDEEIDQILDLNLKALIHMTYDCLPYMRKKSRVINIGSASAFQPLPEFILYATSKVAVLHFSRALHVELKSRRIPVTCVCPGYVRTEFFEVASQTKNPKTCQNFSPMYEPEDVVKKALRDSRRGKDMSVLGWNVKFQRLAAKLLPHSLVMKVWLKIK
ncbi:MAG: SDR family NAD(P)-dependent oxidoreductase [Lachnospiraceae bacterium]|nr:SDR family NAD(P)-dependent oxidoreductase [Lachnospiraceae bacterium]